MSRYVLSTRRSGKNDSEKKRAEDKTAKFWSEALASASGAARHSRLAEEKRGVVFFEAEAEEIEQKRRELPDGAILEKEILHSYESAIPFTALRHTAVAAPRKKEGSGTKIDVTVTGGGKPAPDASVQMILANSQGVTSTLSATTNGHGIADFEFDAKIWFRAAIVVMPAGGHWAMVAQGPTAPTTIDCPPLPVGPIGWWHHAMQITKVDPTRGRGVAIGVVDTGVGPNPFVKDVVDAGAIVHGTHDPKGGADIATHGTHVCGILASTAEGAPGYAGLVPGAKVMSIRVFPPGGGGANQGDVALAIEMMATSGADLINVSLLAAEASQIEHDAVKEAAQHGALCFAAAGNDAGPINYPAAFPEVASCSAVGEKGSAPASSMAAARVPTNPALFGNAGLYLGNFSSFGDGLTCTAPGVGIISTVPARKGVSDPFADMSGTSVASPCACAVAAAVLSGSPQWAEMPRDPSRSEMARKLFLARCADIGLARQYEGSGLPRLNA